MYVQFSLEVAPHPIETKDKTRYFRSWKKLIKKGKLQRQQTPYPSAQDPEAVPPLSLQSFLKLIDKSQENVSFLILLNDLSYGE